MRSGSVLRCSMSPRLLPTSRVRRRKIVLRRFVIREKARALAQGDFDALQRVSTQRANRQNQPFLASMGKSAAKEIATNMEKSISRIQRVVVRNDRAVAILPDNEWVSFVREDGKWKSDD